MARQRNRSSAAPSAVLSDQSKEDDHSQPATKKDSSTPMMSSVARSTWVVFAIYVIFRAMDRVFLKNVQNVIKRPEYNFVFMNVLWPITIQVLTVFMIIGYIFVYKRWMKKDYTYDLKFFLPNNPNASAKGRVPMIEMAFFVVGDQLNASLSGPPSSYINLASQGVIQNLQIVYTIPIAWIFLRTRYTQTHFVGALVLLVAMAAQFGYQVLNNDCSDGPDGGKEAGKCFSAYQSGATGQWIDLSFNQMLFWYILFAFSFVFAAGSNVYKQWVLQRRDVDIWFATFWSGNFQVLWGFLCIPLQWIPFPGQKSPDPPSKLFRDIGYTISCLAGNSPQPDPDPKVGDQFNCPVSPNGWEWATLYFAFNLLFNICLLALTKSQGANWTTIASVLCLLLSSVVGQFHFFMGNQAKILGFYDYIAMILAALALWNYSMFPEKTAPKKGDAGEVELMDEGDEDGVGATYGGEGRVTGQFAAEDLERGVKAPLVARESEDF